MTQSKEKVLSNQNNPLVNLLMVFGVTTCLVLAANLRQPGVVSYAMDWKPDLSFSLPQLTQAKIINLFGSNKITITPSVSQASEVFHGQVLGESISVIQNAPFNIRGADAVFDIRGP